MIINKIIIVYIKMEQEGGKLLNKIASDVSLQSRVERIQASIQKSTGIFELGGIATKFSNLLKDKVGNPKEYLYFFDGIKNYLESIEINNVDFIKQIGNTVILINQIIDKNKPEQDIKNELTSLKNVLPEISGYDYIVENITIAEKFRKLLESRSKQSEKSNFENIKRAIILKLSRLGGKLFTKIQDDDKGNSIINNDDGTPIITPEDEKVIQNFTIQQIIDSINQVSKITDTLNGNPFRSKGTELLIFVLDLLRADDSVDISILNMDNIKKKISRDANTSVGPGNNSQLGTNIKFEGQYTDLSGTIILFSVYNLERFNFHVFEFDTKNNPFNNLNLNKFVSNDVKPINFTVNDDEYIFFMKNVLNQNGIFTITNKENKTVTLPGTWTKLTDKFKGVYKDVFLQKNPTQIKIEPNNDIEPFENFVYFDHIPINQLKTTPRDTNGMGKHVSQLVSLKEAESTTSDNLNYYKNLCCFIKTILQEDKTSLEHSFDNVPEKKDINTINFKNYTEEDAKNLRQYILDYFTAKQTDFQFTVKVIGHPYVEDIIVIRHYDDFFVQDGSEGRNNYLNIMLDGESFNDCRQPVKTTNDGFNNLTNTMMDCIKGQNIFDDCLNEEAAPTTTRGVAAPTTTRGVAAPIQITQEQMAMIAQRNQEASNSPVNSGPSTSPASVISTESTAGPSTSPASVKSTESTASPSTSPASVISTESTAGPSTSPASVISTESTTSPSTSPASVAAPVTAPVAPEGSGGLFNSTVSDDFEF